MYTHYLGQYLFNKNLISAGQLCELLSLEDSTRVKLGILAINSGFMTASQVEEVHELQRQMDRRFGEIAIMKGYLTQAELDNLLSQQNSRHLSLSQAIIDKGYLSLTELEAALHQFKEDTNLSAEQLQAIQAGNINEIVHLFLDFPDNDQIYYDYVALLLKNIIRFLNERPILSWPQPLAEASAGWLISQQAIGSRTLSTGLLLSDSVLIDVASRFSQEKLTQVDELVKDSVSEFLNLHNGIFLINLSDKGVEFDLQPQTIAPNTGRHTGYRIPIDLSCGRIELLLSSS
ncbi:hypothetical protein [Sporomusa acidovorans]|uniref:Bacteriophage N4 adsorption protein B n=1 Tax=Sporomusa acidovorans (strain ATCC 49682 / DSM 3132 / Mol) TaxID=1123286 RepID=A0ABZ3J212_SPOA4|nr:hypothetical protein [Sporomusa acidovorans]OZC13624.1 bacteriophage N4 adsorption protein B [Sporomusa acidovorans DSM 3132]SDE86559.1 hypothetical protein SAMN04488499_102447 [Sporomusa acidovorans]